MAITSKTVKPLICQIFIVIQKSPLPSAISRPVALSRRKHGFDSRWGCQVWQASSWFLLCEYSEMLAFLFFV